MPCLKKQPFSHAVLGHVMLEECFPSYVISNLHNDVHLFSRMYISCQARDSNMNDFFMHENHAWPPSLATNCIMHHTNKSDLMECLESLVPQQESAPNVDVKIAIVLPLCTYLIQRSRRFLSKHSRTIHNWCSCPI